jgi:hypothetical protein
VEFKPFEPPPTDYHGLNTGIGDGGVTAKGFVEGVNKFFEHLFGAVKGEIAPFAEDAQQWITNRFTSLGQHEALEKRVQDLEAFVQSVIHPPAKTEPPAPPAPPQPDHPPETVVADPAKDAIVAATTAATPPAQTTVGLTGVSGQGAAGTEPSALVQPPGSLASALGGTAPSGAAKS